MIKNKLVTMLMILVVAISSLPFCGESTYAYTPELIIDNGITYPISLKTGKDAAGKVVFEDEAFFQYIQTEKFRSGAYNGYDFDLDEDGYLSKEECGLVRIINIIGLDDIHSLKGIEAFIKLRELYGTGSNVTELDLRKNVRLQTLAFSNSKLRKVNLSECTILSDLRISGCNIVRLDLSKNKELTNVSCGYQTRDAYEYVEDSQYKVNLKDLDENIELSKISNVKIDGAYGDNVNSGYNADTGIIYCSDEMQKVSFDYNNSCAVISENVQNKLTITLNISTGYREKFDTNGGEIVLPGYVKEGEPDVAPIVPKKNGYKFLGWYRDASLSEDSAHRFGNVITNNITLYAKWEKKYYKVKYNANGGTIFISEKAGEVDWDTANLIPNSSVIKRIGYIWNGWLTESGILIKESNQSTITYGKSVKGDDVDFTTLTAQWTSKKGYKLKYGTNLSERNANKLKYMPKDKLQGTISWNTEMYLDEQDLYLKGFEFKGWYTQKNGGRLLGEESIYADIYTAQYSDDDISNIPTVYAQFEKKKYTIKYNSLGGRKYKNKTGVTWGTCNLIPKKEPKRKNYIFAGWKCNGKLVTGKTKINSIADSSDIVELKAVWHKKYEKKGTIFKRYGKTYKVIQSNKKGNKVKCIKGKNAPKTVFYNGKTFKVVKRK